MQNLNLVNIKKSKTLRATAIFVIVAAFALTQIVPMLASADEYQEKIDQLSAENAKKEQTQGVLSVEASSLADAINRLQAQIDASQARINQLNGEIGQLRQQIKQAEIELEKQKELLAQSIKAMYVSGEITTVEMLATSDDLSEFFDSQQYQESVRSKIKITLDKVTELKLELNTKKERVEKSLAEQESLRSQLASQRAEKDRVLALNQEEQNKLEAEIKDNHEEIDELRRQQAIANARFIGNAGTGPACGGGYPGSAEGPWGVWGCDYPMDYNIDKWGMYNRQCVSYTAFRVEASGRRMPYWGGHGNANQWDDNARAEGIPVDTTPRPGSVAVSNAGYYGHVMYVEAVNSDGTIFISQYNAAWTGTYSTATISPEGLYFIHFP